jgi:hypothetical protein
MSINHRVDSRFDSFDPNFPKIGIPSISVTFHIISQTPKQTVPDSGPITPLAVDNVFLGLV